MVTKKIHSVNAKRHAIKQEDKLAMIKCHGKGEKLAEIARSFAMSQTTVSTTVHKMILPHIKSKAPKMKRTYQ